MANGLYTTQHEWQNDFIAHLTSDITNVATSIPLDTIPTGTEGCLVIDPDTPANIEIIFYSSKTGTTVVTPANGRGYDSSTASAHLSGTKVIMAPVADDFRTMRTLSAANATYLAAGGGFDFVASGAVITADSAGSTLLATMTSGTCYVGGSPVTIPASTSRAYTANSDTYVDVSSAGALVFTPVSNNAASPALAASSIRLGIVVTGATSIAAAASINQGQETKVLPIASSIPYSVSDSLGNLICPRDPNRKLLGYAQILATFNAGTSAVTDVTGLSTVVNVPTGRKVKITAQGGLFTSGTARGVYAYIRESTTTLDTAYQWAPLASAAVSGKPEIILTPSAGVHTYKLSISCDAGANASVLGSSTGIAWLRVELE